MRHAVFALLSAVLCGCASRPDVPENPFGKKPSLPPSPPGLILPASPETAARAERVTVMAGGLVRVELLDNALHVLADQPAGHDLTLLCADNPAGPWSTLLRSECTSLRDTLTWVVTGEWAERETFVRGVQEPCARLADGSVLAPVGTVPALGAVHDVRGPTNRVRLVEVHGVEAAPAFRVFIALP